MLAAAAQTAAQVDGRVETGAGGVGGCQKGAKAGFGGTQVGPPCQQGGRKTCIDPRLNGLGEILWFGRLHGSDSKGSGPNL